MDQDVLVAALKSQLDFVEQIFNWALVFSAAIAWAGLQKQRNIQAFHVTVDRRNAFVVVAVLYLIATMVVVIAFLRIGDLFSLVDEEHFVKASTTVGTHAWPINPLSYFGPSSIARSHSAEGGGLLIVVWWLCNASLYTLIDVKRSRRAVVLLALFLILGVLSILSLRRAYLMIFERAAEFAPSLHAELLATMPERHVAAGVGIAVGVLIFVATNKLQHRWLSLPDSEYKGATK